jgi:hypothetical protein
MTSPPDELRPARGYSWPPFQPGHELSTTHGAWSDRKVAPLAQALLAEVLEQAAATGSPTSYLADVSYRPALLAWARLEARIELLHVWLADRTDLDDEGEVRPAADLLTRLEGQALKARERLGMDPLSRARLGRDVAAGQIDLAKLLAALGDDQTDDQEGAHDADDD